MNQQQYSSGDVAFLCKNCKSKQRRSLNTLSISVGSPDTPVSSHTTRRIITPSANENTSNFNDFATAISNLKTLNEEMSKNLNTLVDTVKYLQSEMISVKNEVRKIDEIKKENQQLQQSILSLEARLSTLEHKSTTNSITNNPPRTVNRETNRSRTYNRRRGLLIESDANGWIIHKDRNGNIIRRLWKNAGSTAARNNHNLGFQ